MFDSSGAGVARAGPDKTYLPGGGKKSGQVAAAYAYHGIGDGPSPGNPVVATPPIHPGARIGHVHLKVADLERALRFYCDVLGFELTQRYGQQAAFVSAGGYHHHIGLNTWESKGGDPPPPGTTGLYHLAILYPTRASLADALRRVLAEGIPLDGASDHGVSEALYLRDPDDNGVELYWDRPKEMWPREADGTLAMYTRRLDLASLLRESGAVDTAHPTAAGTGPRDVA